MLLDKQRLCRVCDRYGKPYFADEVVSVIFESTMSYNDWEKWLSDVKAELPGDTLEKLGEAAISSLESLSEEIEGFSVGYITPNQSAADSFSSAVTVPREFVVFLSDRLAKRKQGGS